VHRAPGIPHALQCEGGYSLQKLGRMRAAAQQNCAGKKVS
jgi:hypothetical protein